MAVSKSQKIQAEIDKVKAKISEQQARLPSPAAPLDKVSRSRSLRTRRKIEYETMEVFDGGALRRRSFMRI